MTSTPIHSKAFTVLDGRAAPLLQANIDTDVIVRIERLTTVERDQLGPFALEALRYHADGSEDPAFVLNREPFREAPILLTGANFGCGSSREGAVWALRARGVRCVIGESFGDIFFSNCFQNGLLAIRVDAPTLARLVAQTSEGAPLRVDLQACAITLPDGTAIAFEVDPLRRDALLRGLDEIGQTLLHADAIEAWQARDRQARPWVWFEGATA